MLPLGAANFSLAFCKIKTRDTIRQSFRYLTFQLLKCENGGHDGQGQSGQSRFPISKNSAL